MGIAKLTIIKLSLLFITGVSAMSIGTLRTGLLCLFLHLPKINVMDVLLEYIHLHIFSQSLPNYA